MTITDTTTNFTSISVGSIVSSLLLVAISILAVGILSWFLNTYCCNRSKASHDRDNLDIVGDIEEGRKGSKDDTDTTSTIPSNITISRDDQDSSSMRWGRERLFSSNPNSTTQEGHTSSLQQPPSHARLSLKQEYPTQSNTRHITGKESTEHKPSKYPLPIYSFDPPGSGFNKDHNHYERSYPNATIQFRNPINGRKHGKHFFEDGEIDLLVDFLVHVEDYVEYPRSKLTILLCANLPESPDEREELEHLEAIVADAVAYCESPLSVVLTSNNKGQRSTNGSGDETDALRPRCAPAGGILVTFGSVWELPQDHPEFLKDLVI